jgi:ribA/ribD-fused uncharacterized protein
MEFKGDYYFLSNMYPAKIVYEGIEYTCSEAAYQAQKCLYIAGKQQFIGINGYDAKRLGRRVPMARSFEADKLDIMTAIVQAKFKQNSDLLERLMSTGTTHLQEDNTWNDTYWGVCNGSGKNMLGQILMNIRQEYANSKIK